jgi:hypothetical protein
LLDRQANRRSAGVKGGLPDFFDPIRAISGLARLDASRASHYYPHNLTDVSAISVR